MGRTLVIGAGGRLGAALVREWGRVGEDVIGLDRRQLDIANEHSVRSTLERLDFDVLVNCAALTNVDYCETHAQEAFASNSSAVGLLGEIASGKGARCIHISTDYVFNGEQRTPYTETDIARAISVYGESKLSGEHALLSVSEKHLVVRVSWVFGPDRPSFVDQILQKAREQTTVDAIGDKWAVPTYTVDVAEMLRPFLREIPEGGILHLCNSGGCTWREYGQFALDCAAEAGVDLKARTVGMLHMADLKAFVAKRPVYTIMSTENNAAHRA